MNFGTKDSANMVTPLLLLPRTTIIPFKRKDFSVIVLRYNKKNAPQRKKNGPPKAKAG
jgi:hypothetical protein